MPKSQDAASMNFGILGILKHRLQSRMIYTCPVLKGSQRQMEQTGADMHKPELRKLAKKVKNDLLFSMDPTLSICCNRTYGSKL